MSPLIAPAITAELAEILPITTDPIPIFTVPVLLTSPSIFAASAKNSEELLLPSKIPVITNLPLHVTFPPILPRISMEPSAFISPLMLVPSVITVVSSETASGFTPIT